MGSALTDLRFADDIAILADNTTVLQEAVSSLSTTSKRMGLKINGDKTEVGPYNFWAKETNSSTYKWMDTPSYRLRNLCRLLGRNYQFKGRIGCRCAKENHIGKGNIPCT